MSISSIGANFSFPIAADLQAGYDNVKKVITLSIMHGKVIESVNSIADVFFSVRVPFANDFRGSLQSLEGFRALMILPEQIKCAAKMIDALIEDPLFIFFQFLTVDIMRTINKVYDAAGFLERQFAIPFFNGVLERYKSANFVALGIASVVNGYIMMHLKLSRGFQFAIPFPFIIIRELSSAVFAGAMLMEGGSQIKTAAYAVKAFADAVAYYWPRGLESYWNKISINKLFL